MRWYGRRIGGEESGHSIFARYANTGDGLLTAIKVMEVVTETKQPLSILAEEITAYPQLLRNVEVTDKAETMDCEEVREAVRNVEESLGSDGRVVLRPSGTEPVLRVMVEALTDELCEEKVNEIIEAMRKAGKLLKVRK